MPSAGPMWRLPVVAVAVTVVLVALAACGNGSKQPGATAAAPSSSSLPSSGGPAPDPSGSPAVAKPSSGIAVPAGVTAGIVVFDRQTGRYLVQQKAGWRFRSASLVKLMIALDYFWNRGPDYAVPAADRPKLEIMLRSSDDTAASYFWKAAGSRDVVTRMVGRLGLQDSAPPPVSQPGYWGYTAVSAGDLVRIYQYILDKAPAPVREFIMGNLHQSTRCGSDTYNQSFGIPSAFNRPWAVKQGWSGFGDKPTTVCTAGAALRNDDATGTDAGVPAVALRDVALAATPPPNRPDMMGEVLHTTGTIGDNDRVIVVVLTVHPDGTQFAKAVAVLTKLVRTLQIPGATLTTP